MIVEISSKYIHQLVPQSKAQRKIQNMCGVWFKLIINSLQLQLIRAIVYSFIQTVAFVSVHPLNIHSKQNAEWMDTCLPKRIPKTSKMFFNPIFKRIFFFLHFEIQIMWMWSDVLIVLKIDTRHILMDLIAGIEKWLQFSVINKLHLICFETTCYA